MSKRHFTLLLWLIKFLIFPPQLAISVDGNSLFPIAQVKNLGVIMDSSLSPILNSQPINDYFKNIPRIWPRITSTAPILFEPPCLDYCNSLPTSLSFIPPFLPSLPFLKTGAKEILLKCKSDHVTQSLGPAPYYIQSKHRSPYKALHDLFCFHSSSLTSSPTIPPQSFHSTHTWVFVVL